MSDRAFEERVREVEAVVGAARAVYEGRARILPELARSTGLSSEGVRLAMDRHLELSPPEADLESLIRRTAQTERVHVILSAGVFVGALRALAIARAAAPRVTVHASRRDPVFAHALVRALADPAVTLADSAGRATEIHVYGKDETIAAVRAQTGGGVTVRGHGAGLGVAWVSPAADLELAARAIASDVVPFDQRGCLSPRVVLVEGDGARADRLAAEVDSALGAWQARVPRGALEPAEREGAARYAETLAFCGRIHRGAAHLVGCSTGPLLVPPAGRHVHVRAVRDDDEARACLGPIERFVTAWGTDDPARAAAPSHARVSALGAMQRPRLDGPVDLRPASPGEEAR